MTKSASILRCFPAEVGLVVVALAVGLGILLSSWQVPSLPVSESAPRGRWGAEIVKDFAPLRAALIRPSDFPAHRAAIQTGKYNGIVILLEMGNEAEKEQIRSLVTEIAPWGCRLYYWIEVGRDAALAEQHPEWMASLQGHGEWRRFHPDFPEPSPTQVVKNYPWVPILYQETFAAHLARVQRLLSDLPIATGIFLNDLQGAPSACGCGNLLCRWTSDYGPIVTATPIPHETAAAKFVAEVESLVSHPRPSSSQIADKDRDATGDEAHDAPAIIPVWVSECEEQDREVECAGVGCFHGICWKASMKQLASLEQQSFELAALVPLQAFGRQLPRYGSPIGWISQSLKTYQEMPPRHGAFSIDRRRMIAILQGWDMDDELVTQQCAEVASSGLRGYVVALSRIDQRWEPRLHAWK